MDILNITKNGNLLRIDNSFVFEKESGGKIKIPINKINIINIYSHVNLTSDLFQFLNKYNIAINFFQPFTGNYFGTFLYKDIKMSSTISIKQLNAYQYNRVYYIKRFYIGMINNMIFVLKKYQKNNNYGEKITEIIKDIRNNLRKIEKETFDFSNYMLFEAGIWQEFYKSLNLILNKEFNFEKRTKRPPENRVNSLISFINMKLYAQIFNTLKITQLDYRIGFVHELQGNRFSLALDIADIFKPYLSIYFIIYIINNKKILNSDFENRKFNLSEEGLLKLNKEFYKFMNETVYMNNLKRHVSKNQLIKIECYKLVKHFLTNNDYESINFNYFEEL